MNKHFRFPFRTLFLVVIFAIAMAFVEAAVVVYLRELYYPEGFSFPLKILPMRIFVVEFIREAATICMLAVVGWLAGKQFLSRFAYFIIVFGIWDIFYYVFLKLTLNWPISLLEWDVLFLIPIPWLGPVIAPVIVSLFLLTSGLIVLICESQNRPLIISKWDWMLVVLAGLIIISTFLLNAKVMIHQTMPDPYRWEIFLLGILLSLGVVINILRK